MLNLDFYAWITIDFSQLFIVGIMIITTYLVSWIRLLAHLKLKGLFLLLCWLLIHTLVIRFIYSWHRNDDELFIPCLFLSLLATLLLLILKADWLSFPLLKAITLSATISLLVFIFFFERNAKLFLKYKMQLSEKFEYPPYKTFKKELNWESFFKNHSDRKWVNTALIYFFDADPGHDKEFRSALFAAWADYNISHSDNFLF
jgi:hypothetical protein